MKISPIISPEELAEKLQNQNLVLIDAGSGAPAYERYQQKHLQGAHYIDLNEDLAEVPADAKHGGRHPLPSLENFAKVLHHAGISVDSYVVVYDDINASNSAARFWWMMRAAGFENIQVLDGGLQAAENSGLPTTTEIPEVTESELMDLKEWNLPLIDLEGIENFSKNDGNVIIDVRETERYNGETEPIDLVAGHIPNAINLPFKNNLEENGRFKNSEILKAYFTENLGIFNPEKTAVHCGSGVTACHTLLAMDYAGLPLPKLYVGSWSEWSRNEKPIATADSE